MSSGLAFSKEVSGVVGSVDWPVRQIVLDDGTTYTVQRGINLAKFKAGDKVTLRLDDERGKTIVTKVTKADRHLPPPQPKRKSRTL